MDSLVIGILQKFCHMISVNTLLSSSFWHSFGQACETLFSSCCIFSVDACENFGVFYSQKYILLCVMHLFTSLLKDLIGFQAMKLRVLFNEPSSIYGFN